MPAADEYPDVGKATHFTLREGGKWYEWYEGQSNRLIQVGRTFAVKFESGWIWDQLVGWRKPS